MLWDALLGLGLLLGTGRLCLFGLTRVHTTMASSGKGPITTGSTFASHTLTRRLFCGKLALAEIRNFLTKEGDFGEELVHGWLLEKFRIGKGT
jgi:hypothetical protein